ncbi:MAG: hypothetical protein RLZ45_152, partial [Verrucomicrobiota bacterium]
MKHLSALILLIVALLPARAEKTIVLIAGSASHGKGEHEFRAGALLLADA